MTYKSWIDFLGKNKPEIEVDGPGVDHSDIDFLICRLKTEPLTMPDNLLGHCSKCFRMVQFRPHAPREPKRICDECAVPMFADRAGKKDKFVVTQNTVQDLANYIKKGKLS